MYSSTQTVKTLFGPQSNSDLWLTSVRSIGFFANDPALRRHIDSNWKINYDECCLKKIALFNLFEHIDTKDKTISDVLIDLPIATDAVDNYRYVISTISKGFKLDKPFDDTLIDQRNVRVINTLGPVHYCILLKSFGEEVRSAIFATIMYYILSESQTRAREVLDSLKDDLFLEYFNKDWTMGFEGLSMQNIIECKCLDHINYESCKSFSYQISDSLPLNNRYEYQSVENIIDYLLKK